MPQMPDGIKKIKDPVTKEQVEFANQELSKLVEHSQFTVQSIKNIVESVIKKPVKTYVTNINDGSNTLIKTMEQQVKSDNEFKNKTLKQILDPIAKSQKSIAGMNKDFSSAVQSIAKNDKMTFEEQKDFFESERQNRLETYKNLLESSKTAYKEIIGNSKIMATEAGQIRAKELKELQKQSQAQIKKLEEVDLAGEKKDVKGFAKIKQTAYDKILDKTFSSGIGKLTSGITKWTGYDIEQKIRDRADRKREEKAISKAEKQREKSLVDLYKPAIDNSMESEQSFPQIINNEKETIKTEKQIQVKTPESRVKEASKYIPDSKKKEKTNPKMLPTKLTPRRSRLLKYFPEAVYIADTIEETLGEGSGKRGGKGRSSSSMLDTATSVGIGATIATIAKQIAKKAGKGAKAVMTNPYSMMIASTLFSTGSSGDEGKYRSFKAKKSQNKPYLESLPEIKKSEFEKRWKKIEDSYIKNLVPKDRPKMHPKHFFDEQAKKFAEDLKKEAMKFSDVKKVVPTNLMGFAYGETPEDTEAVKKEKRYSKSKKKLEKYTKTFSNDFIENKGNLTAKSSFIPALDINAVKEINTTIIDQQTKAIKKSGESMLQDPSTQQQQRSWMEEAYLTIINTFKKSAENSNIKMEDIVGSRSSSSSGSDTSWWAEMLKKVAQGTTSANDAIVTSSGKIVKLNENDNVYATTRTLNYNRAPINTASPAKPQASTSITKMASIQHYNTQYQNNELERQNQLYSELKKLVQIMQKGDSQKPITVVNNNSTRFNPQTILENLKGVSI